MSLPPIRREVLVDTTAAVAYELFTAHIGAWWPLGDFSVFGSGATVAFEDDGRIVERAPDGDSRCWGEVTARRPPTLLSFTWHPGDRGGPSLVTVTFEARDGQTLVVLEHKGWENYDDPATSREEYGHGWPVVLARYLAHVAASVDEVGAADPATWVALLHRPGPGAPIDGTLFQQPLFAEHVAFLNRMQDHGYLVAAGPLQDQPGEGMTILRLPGADRLDEAERLATEDDVSVARGFFTVAVRPWQVMFTAPA